MPAHNPNKASPGASVSSHAHSYASRPNALCPHLNKPRLLGGRRCFGLGCGWRTGCASLAPSGRGGAALADQELQLLRRALGHLVLSEDAVGNVRLNSALQYNPAVHKSAQRQERSSAAHFAMVDRQRPTQAAAGAGRGLSRAAQTERRWQRRASWPQAHVCIVLLGSCPVRLSLLRLVLLQARHTMERGQAVFSTPNGQPLLSQPPAIPAPAVSLFRILTSRIERGSGYVNLHLTSTLASTHASHNGKQRAGSPWRGKTRAPRCADPAAHRLAAGCACGSETPAGLGCSSPAPPQ